MVLRAEEGRREIYWRLADYAHGSVFMTKGAQWNRGGDVRRHEEWQKKQSSTAHRVMLRAL